MNLQSLSVAIPRAPLGATALNVNSKEEYDQLGKKPRALKKKIHFKISNSIQFNLNKIQIIILNLIK